MIPGRAARVAGLYRDGEQFAAADLLGYAPMATPTERRHPALAARRGRRAGGAARPSRRSVLGQEGPRRVVDPEGRVRRGRGSARVRAARVRGGDGHDAAGGRAGRARLGALGERQDRARPSPPPATSTRPPCAATRSSSSGRRAPGASRRSRRSTARRGSASPRRASGSTPRRPRSSTASRRPRRGMTRARGRAARPGSAHARGGSRTHMPSRAAGFKPTASDQFRHPGVARLHGIRTAAATLNSETSRRSRGLISADPSLPRWKSPLSPMPASPDHTAARRCCGCSPTSA